MPRVEGERVCCELQGPLKPGDGVVFDAGKPEEEEEGGRVYEVRSPKCRSPKWSSCAELRFGRGDIDFNRVHVGDRLWKTSDPELERRLRQSYEGDTPRFQRPIAMEVHGLAGKPLTLIARDEAWAMWSGWTQRCRWPAEKQPLRTERLREQLGRLGGTPFRLGELKNLLAGRSNAARQRTEPPAPRGGAANWKPSAPSPKRWTFQRCARRAGSAGSLHGGMSTPLAAATISTFRGVRMPPLRHLIVLVRNLAAA